MNESDIAYLLSGNWVLCNAPTVAEAVSKLKNGENQLALCRTPFLDPRLQGQGLYGCRV